MMKIVEIGKRKIGGSNPCYIIAEMSGNHGGDFNKAIDIINAAAECGADALKLQTYRPDTITLNSDKKDFIIPSDNPWESHNTLFSLYEKAYTPWEWHEALFKEGRNLGLDVFSTPFDLTSVDFLESLDVSVYKIASPEITDIPLLQKVAGCGKPVMLSTGVATLDDIVLAVNTLRQNGCEDVVLLKCTSAYPTPPENMNLRTIPNMSETFDCIAGLSDHSLGIGIPVAAVSVGAKVIEKHLVFDKSVDSPDAFFSLDRVEFGEMVKEVRKVEKALGKVDYGTNESAKKAMWGRRSLYVAENIKKGDLLTEENIKSVRPAFGLHPKYFQKILGKRAVKDLEIGDRLTWNDIE